MSDEGASDEDPNNGSLRLPATQTEAIVKLLENLNETMEKTREEQNARMQEHNARMEELSAKVKTVVENANSSSELVSLMKSQCDTMTELKNSVKEMTSAMKTLEKNSKLDHDDKPLPKHELEAHEPGWRAAFETLMARTKDQVERWRNGMDSTLIFVALFLTVITAFQGPVSQNLSQNPADLTNSILENLTTMVYAIAMLNGLKVPDGLLQPEPFRPNRTDQVVTMFFYTALLLSLITAIFSVLGRQWVEHLTKKPEEQSYKDRSWRIDIREKLAEKLLRPLLDSLHPILFVSIILFIVGLLFQLWSTSFSAGKPAVLMLTSSLGSALILGTAAVTVYTFVHGVCWEESPFTTSTSLGIRQLIAPRHITAVSKADDEAGLYRLFCSAVKQIGETHHFDQASSVPFEDLLKSNNVDKIELAADTIVSVLGSDASLKAKQTIAWNLCTSHWWIEEEEVQKKVVDCHQRVYAALKSAGEDAPLSQEKVKETFFVARFVVLLRFSGMYIRLEKLENEEIKKVFSQIFKIDPKTYYSEDFLSEAKKDAVSICLYLDNKDPRLFGNINDDNSVLHTFVREVVDAQWKYFTLKHSKEENITEILDIISTESLEENADYFHLFEILNLVINYRFRIFPDNFDISNLIKFATTDSRRFDKISYNIRVSVGSWLSVTTHPVAVLLTCVSLMDETLLSAQQDLLDFFDSLDGHKDGFNDIRDENSRIPTSILVEFRNRVALSAMPLFWEWTS